MNSEEMSKFLLSTRDGCKASEGTRPTDDGGDVVRQGQGDQRRPSTFPAQDHHSLIRLSSSDLSPFLRPTRRRTPASPARSSSSPFQLPLPLVSPTLIAARLSPPSSPMGPLEARITTLASPASGVSLFSRLQDKLSAAALMARVAGRSRRGSCGQRSQAAKPSDLYMATRELRTRSEAASRAPTSTLSRSY